MELPLPSRGEQNKLESCATHSNQGGDGGDPAETTEATDTPHHHMFTLHFPLPKHPETISKRDKEGEREENLSNYPFYF